MFQLLTIITTITGIFTILDLFIEKNAKAKVAEFVFGFGTADFAGFESTAIKALLGLFKVDDRLSFKRILFRYSGAISLTMALMLIIFTYVIRLDAFASDTPNTLKDFLYLIVAIPILALMFWPFDCWSLTVTNRIFGKKQSSSILQFIGRVVTDIIITILPLVLLTAGVFLFMANFPATEGPRRESLWFSILTFVSFLIILNVFGSLLVTIIQLLTLAIGVCLRTILRLTRLNQHLAMISRAHEFPFTFIGLIFGVITSLSVIAFT